MMKRYIQTFLWFFITTIGTNQTIFSQITDDHQKAAQEIMGLDFDQEERDLMRKGLENQLKNYQDIRKVPLPNSIMPAVGFQPLPAGFQNPGSSKNHSMDRA